VQHIQAAVGLLAAAHLETGRDQAAVAARQEVIGVELPAAVAEWYSLVGAQELIKSHSCDELVPLGALGDPMPYRDFNREDLIFLGRENQGVVFWAVPFDEGPDPRVLVDVSPPGGWTTYAASFSDYAETLLWDLLMFGPGSEIDAKGTAPAAWHGVAAQDPPLAGTDLATLARRFDERPRTYAWPTPTAYRFERSGQKVLLWAADDQTDWWVFADTPGRLDDLVGELRGLGDLAANLYGLTEIGAAVLREHHGACS
jgi:hypothetical protein